jgi:uracil-DNA glycosylase family 4
MAAAAAGKREAAGSEPPHDCPLCPRLVEFRERNRKALPDFHNAPVASFGPRNARLLIVGLAPGLKGANRTGRPFTGDYAGELLYASLIELGLARGTYRAAPSDGLLLVGCRITNAVRCVPPENKPTGLEARACRAFLGGTLAEMPEVKAILALGRIAHENVLSATGTQKSKHPFAHGAAHRLASGLQLVGSYHCSRYNTSTNRLTPEMFLYALRKAKGLAGL